MKVVVADTSPLNYLVLTDSVEILARLFGRVTIPDLVLAELNDRGAPEKVAAWIAEQPEWIEVQSAPLTEDAALEQLDPGERAAILLAQQHPDVLLLIDDVSGRMEATKRKIPTMGTLGVLRAAAVQGFIELRPVLARLTATNFRVSTTLVDELLTEDDERKAKQRQ